MSRAGYMNTDGHPFPFVPSAEFTITKVLECHAALRKQNPLPSVQEREKVRVSSLESQAGS